jgi:hypothetical protein
MHTPERVALVLLAGSALLLTAHLGAQTAPNTPAKKAATAGSERDGQHDFDFELGSWEIHLQKRLRPLTGSNDWVRFDGTSVTRRVWDGRAQLEEF